MRNLLSKGLVVVAGIAGIPAGAAQPDAQPAGKAQIRPVNEDPRVSSIRQFFQKNNSPVERFSDLFVSQADLHGLDWRLLPTIAMVESGGGKHCLKNNLFGWMNGKAAFDSVENAIKQVAWHLANSQYYRHKSVDRVLATYNKDPQYRVKVKLLMQMIAPAPNLPTLAMAR